MDKNTLSNYGWIVIAVLVLSVMIALATPFGKYVENGVRSTTQGLISTTSIALSAIDDTIIPSGGIYKSADGTVYNSGEKFPEIQNGDIYEYDDYKYCYGYAYCYNHNDFSDKCKCFIIDGWSARVKDRTRTQYGQMLTYINQEPLTSMMCTFYYCDSLITAPEIPQTVNNLFMAFENCFKLTKAPTIPNSVTSITAAFCRCYALDTAPIVPYSVKSILWAFYDCTSLTGIVEINANLSDDGSYYGSAFTLTKQGKDIILTGTTTRLIDVANTSTSGYRTIYDINGNIITN